jgi:unsaturated rhamnogalacturonyl hydrolase
MKRFTIFLLIGATLAANAQPASSSDPATVMAATLMQRWPDTGDSVARRFSYGQALTGEALEHLWYNTGDARYYKYIQLQVDHHLNEILAGRLVLTLYNVTGQEKYYKAAQAIRTQLEQQPVTSGDTFSIVQPFLAEYAAFFHEDSLFSEIAKQIAAAQPLDAYTAGWYGIALVDALDYFPANHPGRKTLQKLLTNYARREIMSDADVYTLAKAVRKGYLPIQYRPVNLPAPDVPAAGYILAATELDMQLPTGKTVLLDYYYNNEHKKDPTGATIRFHYIWNEMDNNGYAIWGHIFNKLGAHTDTLTVAPTAANLAKASVYIIVDPDNEKESPSPNYPNDADITAIENWVKAGGVLVLMANDSANCEFTHFNRLAARFGIQFNFDDYHKVTGNQFEMGAFTIAQQNEILKTTNKIYIKELSTLSLSGPAKPVFTDAGHNIMAVARVGKGTVFAVGDPWFYNEYTDGRKLPVDFENYNAARDLAQWLLAKAKTK